MDSLADMVELMELYSVSFSALVSGTFCVEAENDDEASEKASQEYLEDKVSWLQEIVQAGGVTESGIEMEWMGDEDCIGDSESFSCTESETQ